MAFRIVSTHQRRLPFSILASYAITAAVVANVSGYGIPFGKYGWHHGWPRLYLLRGSALVPAGPNPSPDDPCYTRPAGQLPFDRAAIIQFRLPAMIVNSTVALLAIVFLLWAYALLWNLRRRRATFPARGLYLLVLVLGAVYCFGFGVLGRGDARWDIAGLLTGLTVGVGSLAAIFASTTQHKDSRRRSVLFATCILLSLAGMVTLLCFPYPDVASLPFGRPPIVPASFGLVTSAFAATCLIWACVSWMVDRLPLKWLPESTLPAARLALCCAIPAATVLTLSLWYWPAAYGSEGLLGRMLLLTLWPLLVSSQARVVWRGRKRQIAFGPVRALTAALIAGIAACAFLKAGPLSTLMRLYTPDDLALFAAAALLWLVPCIPQPTDRQHSQGKITAV